MFLLDKEQFLELLRGERGRDFHDGVYRGTQVLFAQASNAFEGVMFSLEDVQAVYNADDVRGSSDVQTIRNHFDAFDFVMAHIDDQLTAGFIKQLHVCLMEGTQDAKEEGFVQGDWREVARFFGKLGCPSRLTDKLWRSYLRHAHKVGTASRRSSGFMLISRTSIHAGVDTLIMAMCNYQRAYEDFQIAHVDLELLA